MRVSGKLNRFVCKTGFRLFRALLEGGDIFWSRLLKGVTHRGFDRRVKNDEPVVLMHEHGLCGESINMEDGGLAFVP